MRYLLRGRVEKGKLLLHRKDFWGKVLASFEGKDVTLSLGRAKKKRSIPQLRYLFGVVYKMIDEAVPGQMRSKDDWHAFFKMEFYSKVVFVAGKERLIPGSTKEMDTLDLMEFTDKVVQWAAENLNLIIPPPNTAEPDEGYDVEEEE